MIDLLHNMPFVLGCDYKFADRFDAQRDYFVPKIERKEIGGFINWESNFIADARAALVDPFGSQRLWRAHYFLRHGRQHIGRSYRRVAGRTLS